MSRSPSGNVLLRDGDGVLGTHGRRRGRVVLGEDRRAARGRSRVPGDLDRTHPWSAAVDRGVDRGDDQVVAVEADADPGVDQLVGHRVAHPVDRHGGVTVHPPGGAERHGERRPRQRVQPGLLFGQHLHRRPTGLPMHPRVDLLAPGPARRLEHHRGPPVDLQSVWTRIFSSVGRQTGRSGEGRSGTSMRARDSKNPRRVISEETRTSARKVVGASATS
jgi:hypothetical protein